MTLTDAIVHQRCASPIMKFSVLNIKITVAALLIALGKFKILFDKILVVIRCIAGKSQDIPDGLNPQDLLDYIDKRVENFCPTGFEKCECVHAPGRLKGTLEAKVLSDSSCIPGNFTTGPFNFKDDLLGSLLTMMGCNPGKII